jgi:hypothetical protein
VNDHAQSCALRVKAMELRARLVRP